jgi:hypothetical protein
MAVVKLEPKPRRPVRNPATAHLRRHPMGVCTGCGVGASFDHILYTDTMNDDWHADCYVRVKRHGPPKHWSLGRRVLPFTR